MQRKSETNDLRNMSKIYFRQFIVLIFCNIYIAKLFDHNIDFNKIFTDHCGLLSFLKVRV